MVYSPSTRTEHVLCEAQERLRNLSPERLEVANDFLAYLEDRESSEATAELLAIPGFQDDLERAIEQAENGDTVSLKAIRRNV